MLEVLPIEEPFPQLPWYHAHDAPEMRLPFTVKVIGVELPTQNVLEEGDTEVGALGNGVTETVVEAVAVHVLIVAVTV